MTHTPADPEMPSGTLFAPGRRAACTGAIALISMLAFETLAVVTAMPAVAAALDGLQLYALAFGVTLATSMVGMVLGGEVCDRRGARRSTVLGLLLFLSGLLLAGLAPQMALLVLGRAVQGLGGGMLGVALYVGLGQLVPAALHPKMFAMFAAAWVVPGLVGPALASLLVITLGWRWVFLAVALAVPVAAGLLLPALRRAGRGDGGVLRWQRLRWAVAAAAGAVILHLASQAGAWAWPLLLLGLALALWAAAPLLPPGSLRAQPGLPAVVLLRGLLAAAYASAEAFIPLVLNHRFEWSLGAAGLALSVGAGAWSLGSAMQARAHQPARRRLVFQLGLGLCAAGLLLVWLTVSRSFAAPLVVLGWGVALTGVGLSFPMLSVLTLQLSAPEEQGANSSALQLSDALFSSAALALAGLLYLPETEPFAAVLAVSLAVALLALALGPRAYR